MCVCVCVCVCVLATQSYPTFLEPMDCSQAGSSAHGIFQVRILKWVVIPFSRGCIGLLKFKKKKNRNETSQYKCCKLTVTGKYIPVCVSFTQSCPAVCDPMDCNPPGSSVHGILQTSTLEWVAIPFSKASSQPRD